MPQLQLLTELPGHTDPAWCVTFNPTRPLLASCSTDKTVRLYSYSLPPPTSTTSTTGSTFPSPSSSKPQFNLLTSIPTAHKRTVRSIAWAPNGRTLATASFDSTVGVWEEVDEDGGDGTEGVYAGEDEDGDVRLGGEGGGKDWECVTTLEGHESECKSVGFSSDGSLLASCSRDKSVWIWEVQPDSDFECISVLMEHVQDVKCLAWHPHEEILASASYDSQIHLLHDDPDSDWSPFQKLHPHLPQAPLTLSPPPKSSPSLIRAMIPTPKEKEANDKLKIPPLIEDETVWSLAWSPCGRFLASGGDLGGVRIWWRSGNITDSKMVEKIHTVAHSRACFSLTWSKGGIPTSEGGLGLLASAGGDGKIIVWQITAKLPESGDGEVKDGRPTGDVELTPIAAVRDAHGVSDVNSIGWCVREDGKGEGMLASCGDDGGVKVWRVVADE